MTVADGTSRVQVPLGERAYPVVVGRGLLERVASLLPRPEEAAKALVVTQGPVADYATTVADTLDGAGLQTEVATVHDGERAKSLNVLEALARRAARTALGRHDLIVAVGGGVVGDLAGFLAATYNRGMTVLQVPTTLLAQVDAAIGGKTGVNLPEGKNLVGAFHQPAGVLADVDTLATLDERLLVEGLAEVVKYGLIRDPVILELLEANPEDARAGEPDLLADLVVRSARVKADVVAADETEAGERQHLNLGHTLGHALEVLGDYEDLLHGEAIAIGTCLALRLGARVGIDPEPVAERGEALLAALGLPTTAPAVDRGQLWATMARDKKARGGQVRFVLLDDLAEPTVTAPDRAQIDAAIDAITPGSDGGDGGAA